MLLSFLLREDGFELAVHTPLRVMLYASADGGQQMSGYHNSISRILCKEIKNYVMPVQPCCDII